MPLFSFEGKRPGVPPTACGAPTAVLVGDVTVEANASVWYNAVLRADFHPIVIRRGANVQDCSVVHVTPYAGTEVGPGATIGHNCTVHAAFIAEEALVGNGATVLDGARIGVRAMVAAGAPGAPENAGPAGMPGAGARPPPGRPPGVLGARDPRRLPGAPAAPQGLVRPRLSRRRGERPP